MPFQIATVTPLSYKHLTGSEASPKVGTWHFQDPVPSGPQLSAIMHDLRRGKEEEEEEEENKAEMDWMDGSDKYAVPMFCLSLPNTS